MKLRCPTSLVEELVDDNSMLSSTVSVTGVHRLALDWLDMKKEIDALRGENRALRALCSMRKGE